MALNGKGGRMLKVALKESTLEVIDKTMPEQNINLYAPSKRTDDNLASLLSEEDMYSDYDDDGNKINVYKKDEAPKTNYVGIILTIFAFTVILLIGLVIMVVAF